ncbi:methyltransferase domain-containing protein [Lusitaniella coriacea LEGE 07157]|uniref:Methyltransferase domain-containing protein n=1 Tax=Lusitaniella coriacea LEGE 07157 TaxID=945747 RepID=A0A8J7DX46_9CYAN|nr:methyltransferase domain-containing protein [Lusitaniella coriacea]MBE9116856.1 methyltransferase domain-containing protein [Lusitaniella coriacea LEGE 07157]
MNPEQTDKLYLYYEREQTLPTFARFNGTEELDRYESQRANVFTEKLNLPTQIFKDAKLLEFGPDSGENALAFARWGASLTLVEPNPDAHTRILAYFEKFNLKIKLENLVKEELAKFKSDKKFDFIDAEGFIYTFRPESIWLELFKELLDDNGFALVNYYEAAGGFFELILKLIHARVKSLTGLEAEENAWKLFQPKWDSIPHTRAFKSWVMDVLENPFVRYEYFFDAGDLCKKLFEHGYSLYSSWPNYIDRLDIYWHKKQLSESEKLQRNLEFIARSRLSFTFGKKLFLTHPSATEIQKISDDVTELIVLVDGLIDRFETDKLEKARDRAEQIKTVLNGDAVLADSEQDKQEAIQLVGTIQRIFDLLAADDVKGLTEFCHSDPAFIKNWGIPYHFIVFQKQK